MIVMCHRILSLPSLYNCTFIVQLNTFYNVDLELLVLIIRYTFYINIIIVIKQECKVLFGLWEKCQSMHAHSFVCVCSVCACVCVSVCMCVCVVSSNFH